MKHTFALAALLLLTLAPAARADNCSQIAIDLAAQYGAEVISVKAEGGMCSIKLRIPGQDGQPPRIETVTVPG